MKHLKGKPVEKPESEVDFLRRRVEELEKEFQKQNPKFKPPKRKVLKLTISEH